MNVCFCFDNRIAPYVFNAINSINKNTKEKVNYYFITDKLFPEMQERLRNIGMCTAPFSFEVSHFCTELVSSKAMFYRWLIPGMFDIDKCIYLDVDVIVNTDIKKLWDIDIKENIVGAVPDCFGHSIRKTRRFQGEVDEADMYTQYNVDLADKSFLSGQLLIDCVKWRKNNTTEKLIDFVSKCHTADMLALNVILNNKIYALDYKWSAPAKFIDEHLQASNPTCIHKDYKDSYLYHYHGTVKPWGPFPNKRLKKLWESYS
jgi:lipopolysaccharide biosynthesis glycosyltransferase